MGIWEAASKGITFPCHKTVNYEDPKDISNRRTCAGFLNVAIKEGIAEDLQIVQVARRLSGITLDGLRGAELCYDSKTQMIEAHATGKKVNSP